MRLIDADALKVYHGICVGRNLGGTRAIVLKADIDKAPTIEVECKTGEWIEDAKTYYEQLNERGLGVDEYTPYFVDDIACSVCLAKYSVLDNETQFFKYCPNCGAKMENEDEQL